MSNNPPQEILRQKSLMIEALEAHYGSIKNAAKAVGISQSTHFRWMKEDEDYERKANMSRDVGYRNLKDNVIEIALRKAEKGNAAVINQMMRTFLKYMPDEMKDLSRSNNVPLTAKIRYVNTRKEAGELMKERGELPPDAEW